RAAGRSPRRSGCAWHAHLQAGRAAGRAVEAERAARGDDTVRDAVQSPAGLQLRAADAVVLDPRPQLAGLAPAHRDTALAGTGMLRRVRQRLSDREVHGGLGVAAATALHADVELHGDVRAAGQR